MRACLCTASDYYYYIITKYLTLNDIKIMLKGFKSWYGVNSIFSDNNNCQ